MKKVRVLDSKLIDEEGKQILFNGLCFICREKSSGYLEPNIQDKLKYYAEHGFNLIRLGIFWDGVEPEAGKYNEEYLNRIASVIEVSEALGMYVILDMHQDLFSVKYCDGAPEWATLDEGLYHPEDCNVWYEAYVKSPAVIKVADNFWANAPAEDGVGLLQHYEQMWTHIAQRFNQYDNILGLEPMNEPYMGSIAPNAFMKATDKIREKNEKFSLENAQAATEEERIAMMSVLTEEFMRFDKEILMPFYNRMLKAIRKSSSLPIVTGANIYCSSFVKTGLEKVTNPKREVDGQQIYAPHGYDSVVDTDNYDLYNKDNVTQIFAEKYASQQELGLPVIVGEWGNFPSVSSTPELIEHMNRILEKYLWSSTYHQYIAGMENDENYNLLERAYPIETSGNLVSYEYKQKEKEFKMTWEAVANKECAVYFPDLRNFDNSSVIASNEVTIRIRRFEKSTGGLIYITPLKDALYELLIR